MSETSPHPTQPDTQTLQYGSFLISRKTDLTGMNAKLSEVQYKVGQDILQNAKEVFPAGTDWNTLLDILKLSNSPAKGAKAIRSTYGYTMAATAQNGDWTMHSPEVVYMSAQHIMTSMNTQIRKLGDSLSRIKSGERTFLTEQAGYEQQAKEGSTLTLLNQYKETMQPELGRYVEEVFGNDTRYAYFLRKIFYINNRPDLNTDNRRRLITCVKEHKYEEAMIVLRGNRSMNQRGRVYPPQE